MGQGPAARARENYSPWTRGLCNSVDRDTVLRARASLRAYGGHYIRTRGEFVVNTLSLNLALGQRDLLRDFKYSFQRLFYTRKVLSETSLQRMC